MEDVMRANAIGRSEGISAGEACLDPLQEDTAGDVAVVTTRRSIARVALVATEVASRFQRDGVRHDAMAWMFAPRRLFHGASALDACLDRDACLRGVLVHGLSLGLDADPAAVDALSSDAGPSEDAMSQEPLGDVRCPAPVPKGPRLFTATVVSTDEDGTLHAFHASIARDEREISDGLRLRIGCAAAAADVMEGFDPSSPMAMSLVSESMRDMLAMIAADPDSPLAAGLVVHLEQRFAD